MSVLSGAISGFKNAVSQVKQQVQTQTKKIQKVVTQVKTQVKTTYEKVVQEFKAQAKPDSTSYQTVTQNSTPLKQIETGVFNKQPNQCVAPNQTPLLNPAEAQYVKNSVAWIQGANQNVTTQSEEIPSWGEIIANHQPSASAMGELATTFTPLFKSPNLRSYPTPDFVRAAQSFENSLIGQNSYVQNAILFQTKPQLIALGQKMPQLQVKEEIIQAIKSFSRTGEAMNQDNIHILTQPIASGMQQGGISQSGSPYVARGMQTAIESGDGALFSAALTQEFTKKIETGKQEKPSEEQSGLLKLTKKFSSAISDGLKSVKEKYDQALAPFQKHASVLSQAIQNNPQFNQSEVEAGINNYKKVNPVDFQNYQDASQTLASTIQGANYINSGQYYKISRKDDNWITQFKFNEAEQILGRVPLLMQSQALHETLPSGWTKNMSTLQREVIPEIISNGSQQVSSYFSFVQETEKIFGDKAPPIIGKIGAGFSGISATANAYQFKQDPNVDNALNLSSNAVEIGSILKPTSQFLGRTNIFLSGASVVSELHQGDLAGAATDGFPLLGLACGPYAPACMAGGAAISAGIDTARSAYENSQFQFQKQTQPFIAGALTEMNRQDPQLNLSAEKIENASYYLRDVNGDFLGMGPTLIPLSQRLGQDPRVLFQTLIQQEDGELKDFVNQAIRSYPDDIKSSSQLYFEPAAIKALEKSYLEITTNGKRRGELRAS